MRKGGVAMRKRKERFLFVVLGIFLACLLGACESIDHDRKKDAAVVAPPPVETSKFIFHRVMERETMRSIAKWYSGDEALWYELKEENPNMDPNRLNVGDIVKVPVKMAIVHTEQPPYSTAPKPKKTGKGGQAGPDLPDDAAFGPK